MSLTDEPDDDLTDQPTSEAPVDEAEEPVPTKSTLWWPVVQALREMGRPATGAEVVDHVADSLNLTQRQRTQMIPAGQQTRLQNRVNWATHELKEIGAVHSPKRGYRALTELGQEIDEERIAALRAEFLSSKSPTEAELAGQQQAETPAAWRIRAGGRGEFAESFIESEIVAVDFGQLPDLSEVSGRDEIAELVSRNSPKLEEEQVRNRARQLWTFRSSVHRGDLVVMPCKDNAQFALGTVRSEYWYRHDSDNMRHAVEVDWRPTPVPRTAVRQDLLRSLETPPTVLAIGQDSAWRLHQLLETGKDPGPRADDDSASVDLSALVERFRAESGYPTEAHEEQERLRAEWAEKLARENVASLTREDLLAYTSNAVDYGQYVDRGEDRHQQWIVDLDDAQYDRLLDSIRDLCWGDDDLSIRIDRLVDRVGGSNRDTGTKGFTGIQVSRTLAICHSEQFLPTPSQIGVWGREPMLRALGLPEPQGSYGQRAVAANDRLRQHLAPYFDDDPQAIACFLYWLVAQETDSNGNEPSDLSALVEQFRAETDYPTAAHAEQHRLREEWAQKLASENIANLSRHDLTAVASHGTWPAGIYVYPHVQGVMQWIRDLDDDEYSRMLDHIRYLCWDEDELWRRYDQLTDSRSDRRTKGLVHSTTSRLLAICHPNDFLAIGVQGGRWGRAAMLHRLGLPKPTGSSYGQRVLDANDRLREHLEPDFGDDTLEMAAFLGWLLHQEPPPGPNFAELAGELLVNFESLEDIVELLKDKGQVILYGPPGTGKTYLARALAKVLAPDESCRALVQFHPSTSYEDFFEGYRPAGTGDDGGIRFELTRGPLARMAEQASESSEQHVMIIDEINRGNLPRVLGELLFLLEYRDEEVETLYRTGERFSLPENLWFIGTMNTADRSIALVDAALRRRFHFVPFFPDQEPMAGLLGRWLEREDEPGWVGDLVDKVNDELKKALEGSHLLLGPSHFMRKYGSSPDEQRERLRRIWKYNIEPFIEDQFFGDPEQIDRFRFDAVMMRNGPAAQSDVEASDDGDDQESANSSEGEPAAADGDAAAEPGSSQPEDEQ